MKSLLFIFTFLFLSQSIYARVIGIDFGGEWMKVALVGPKTFDIVLNDQSTRKTPSAVGFDRGDFLIGVDAMNLQSKSPKTVFSSIQLLLGKQYNDQIMERVPYFLYSLEKEENRNIYAIPYDTNITFIPEDLAGMLLNYAKETATKSSGFSIKDCVITVPMFWTQSQRQALLDAAQLAGLHVLSLINENSAAALNYASGREFSEQPQHVIIYDMGATSTKVALVQFKANVDSKTNKTTPQITILQQAWDTTLGGKQYDDRLVQHLIQEIKKAGGPDITKEGSPRLYARLLKEAVKIKEILSANTATRVYLESLTSDFDFKGDITRQKFEELCEDLNQRATAPLQQILQATNITTFDGVEIIGGGVRVPRVQEVLAKFMNRSDLDKHLNGDESSVMGATFYAATLSSSFRVKEFKLKDVTPFSSGITIKSESSQLDKSTELFKNGNRLGSKKSITFNSNENFTVNLYYQQSINLPENTVTNLGSWYISGIPTQEEYNFTGTPKVSLHCRLTISGIVSLESAEAEVTVLIYPQDNPEVKTEESQKTEGNNSSSKSEDGEEAKADEEKGENKPMEAQEQETKNTESTDEETIKTDDKEEDMETTKTKELKPKKRIHRIPLKITPISTMGMSTNNFKDSLLKLADIKFRTEKKKELEKEKNNLESYIYQNRERISDNEEVKTVTTEEQRENFIAQLNEVEEWLYSEEATAAEYKAKFKELKKQGDAIQLRVSEMTRRPQAVENVQLSISAALQLIENVTETLETKEGEVEEILDLCNNLMVWLDTKEEEQNKLQPHNVPAFTSIELINRWKVIEPKVKTLLRRPKKKPPKVDIPTNTTVIKPEEEKEEKNEEIDESQTSDSPQESKTSDSSQESTTESEHKHDEL